MLQCPTRDIQESITFGKSDGMGDGESDGVVDGCNVDYSRRRSADAVTDNDIVLADGRRVAARRIRHYSIRLCLMF